MFFFFKFKGTIWTHRISSDWYIYLYMTCMVDFFRFQVGKVYSVRPTDPTYNGDLGDLNVCKNPDPSLE